MDSDLSHEALNRFEKLEGDMKKVLEHLGLDKEEEAAPAEEEHTTESTY